MSLLSQPPNRTPRGWQKLQELDGAEDASAQDASTPRPRVTSASATKQRPGWLSERQSSSAGCITPRVQSARARRPPEWKSSASEAEDLGATARSVLSGLPAGEKVSLASLEQIQAMQDSKARQDMREFRDQLFENPKRRFSKREREHFCLKLLGNTDIQQMQKICSRTPEDRSQDDCMFLCKMMKKCSFLQENLPTERMLAAARCVQCLSLAPGEDLHVYEKTPQVFILVQGLMADPISGNLVKQNDYILRMPESKPSLQNINPDSKWATALGSLIKTKSPRLGKGGSFRLKRQSSGRGMAGKVSPFGPSPRLSSAASPTSVSSAAGDVPPLLENKSSSGLSDDTPLLNRNSSSGLFNELSLGADSLSLEADGKTSLDSSNKLNLSGALQSIFANGNGGESESDPSLVPTSYKSLQHCHLLVFNLPHLSSLADSLELDLKAPVWMCTSAEEASTAGGSKADDWRKVVCLIQGGMLVIVSPEGVLHKLVLSGNYEAAKVAAGITEAWHHTKMHLEGFDPDAVFFIQRRLENGQHGKRIVLTAMNVEDSDTWLQAITFYTHKRKILRADSGGPGEHSNSGQASQSVSRAASATSGLSRVSSFGLRTQGDKDRELIKQVGVVHDRMLQSRIAEIAEYVMSLKIFASWSLKETHALANSVQTMVFYRGQTIFDQNSPVKGIYVLRCGTVQMVHTTSVHESELRFPGREDLIMEEEIEFRVKNVQRNVPLGSCKEPGTFGEELAGKLPLKSGTFQQDKASPNASHAYSLISESTCVLMLIPWQAYQERLEEKRSPSPLRTLELLGHQKRNRAGYIETRVRYYRGSRFFVDLAKYKHLNPGGYMRAMESVQSFMDLYKAIIRNSDPGQQVQHFDVQAAEAAVNKSVESLDCVSRTTRTGGQTKEVRRLIGAMVEDMRGMLQEIRDQFQQQMQLKLVADGRAKPHLHSRAHHPTSPNVISPINSPRSR